MAKRVYFDAAGNMIESYGHKPWPNPQWTSEPMDLFEDVMILDGFSGSSTSYAKTSYWWKSSVTNNRYRSTTRLLHQALKEGKVEPCSEGSMIRGIFHVRNYGGWFVLTFAKSQDL